MSRKFTSFGFIKSLMVWLSMVCGLLLFPYTYTTNSFPFTVSVFTVNPILNHLTKIRFQKISKSSKSLLWMIEKPIKEITFFSILCGKWVGGNFFPKLI